MKGVQGNQAAQVRMFAHDAIPVALGAINPDNGITLDSGGYGYAVGNTITLNTPSSGAAAQLKVTSVGTSDIINVQANGGKFYLDGQEKPAITLNRGTTYVFYQKASSNAAGGNHPLQFSETSGGSHGGGSEYTNGVTDTGTVGTSRVVTFAVPSNAPNTLYYYCPNHNNMGAAITIQDSGTDYAYTTTAVKSFDVIRLTTAKPFGKGYAIADKVQPTAETYTTSLPSAFIGKVASIDLPSTAERGACIYIGVKMASIVAKMESGQSATFKGISAGSFMPILVKEITAATVDSGSLADNDIIALY